VENCQTRYNQINMGSIIRVEKMEKTYPGKIPTRAVKGVSFEIEKGEFVALMGKSGSGKSTILHQLGLIDTPTSGSIEIGGINVLSLSDHEKTLFRLRKIGYVFQEYATLSELTILENVCLPLQVLGTTPEAEIVRSASSLLSHLVLGQRLSHYPDELSGGEQQRVAIARALINRPEIILADEPCANLDSSSAKDVMNTFLDLNKNYGQTILLVTHDEDDRAWVNRILWIKDGLITNIEEPNKAKPA